MKLLKLLSQTKYTKIIGNQEIEIKDVKMDSNLVCKGSVFICIGGNDFNGHDYIRQAENYGAVAIVTEKVLDTTLTQIIVENSRVAMSSIAQTFYGNAHKQMKIVGVTGTNGKTTTTHYITSILANSGVKCGLIGTLGTFYANKYIESNLTTPDPIELHKLFRDMYDSGVKVVVMEVSAHAIYYEKIAGITFDVAVFTNLTQDHLDFFQDMNAYKKAKLSFFNKRTCKSMVINSDDKVGIELLNKNEKAISYGILNPADVFAVNVVESVSGTEFVINLFDCIYQVKLNLIGNFNVYNALAAATTCALLGVKTQKIIEGIEQLKGVSGRLEKVYDKNFSVFVDYAHTPDGLEKTLTTFRRICDKRIICVFGCGGNRDKSKRQIMGKISGKNADFTVLTSDNPRYEEPMEIIHQIEKGVLEICQNYIIIQDRFEAIRYALSKANDGDVVVISGKGSERYQEVYGIKNLFNDKDTVEEILGR